MVKTASKIAKHVYLYPKYDAIHVKFGVFSSVVAV